MISDVQSAGAMPTLGLMMRFSARRHQVIAHNIANAQTPNFTPADVDVRGFQAAMRDAIDDRRGGNGGSHGGLAWRGTRDAEPTPGGGLALSPRAASGNILFHDRNNRDVERMMQTMVENASVFQAASGFYQRQKGVLTAAIAERVA